MVLAVYTLCIYQLVFCLIEMFGGHTLFYKSEVLYTNPKKLGPFNMTNIKLDLAFEITDYNFARLTTDSTTTTGTYGNYFAIEAYQIIFSGKKSVPPIVNPLPYPTFEPCYKFTQNAFREIGDKEFNDTFANYLPNDIYCLDKNKF